MFSFGMLNWTGGEILYMYMVEPMISTPERGVEAQQNSNTISELNIP